MGDWSDTMIEKLRHYVMVEKMSAGEAEAAMKADGYQLSRNAVIGKVHRLGLSFWRKPSNVAKARRPSPATPGAVNTAPRVAKVIAARKGSTPEPAIMVNKKAVVPIMERAADAESGEPRSPTLLELRNDQCHWPLGNFHDTPPYFYCGAPVIGEGCSWCSQHHRIAHDRTIRFSKGTSHAAVGVEA
ncbi:GcrA family cell cycle regulator [Bradyrhizobium sp. 2S1]|uniref:GcrA family cell cycle regulator n=1 Tax=Bradyrhizobium sp. 2S1 TaxID=1404429 RepID=UPI00289643B8|nr:GcrA family cell cycle regulator [Bradyrhizobium sp. 2S1]